MFTSQAVADLAFMLSGVMPLEAADEAITRALRATGLHETPRIDTEQYLRLVAELSATGGLMEQMAMQFAVDGIDAPSPVERGGTMR